MSLEYVEKRVKEALEMTGGNAASASRQIMEWAAEDVKLLQALARPHLQGIVAYNVDRVASGRSDKAKRPGPAKAKTVKDKNTFGLEILKAIASDGGARFGLENPVAGRRPGTSKQHKDAIAKMVRRLSSKDSE